MTVLEIEPITTSARAADDPDVDHWVCHCGGDAIAWCGLNVAGIPFVSDDEDGTPDCPLCVLAGERPTCPWGCTCDECGLE